MNGAGSCGPGPAGAGGPGGGPGGNANGAGGTGAVRPPGGAAGSGTGVPGTFGAGPPGPAPEGMPGEGGKPFGSGGDICTSIGAGKTWPPYGPMVAPAQGIGFHGRGRPSSPVVILPPGFAGVYEHGDPGPTAGPG